MEGRKIKNIVIVILLLLNGFLLVLAGGRWAEASQSHDSARGSAIEIIRAGGILLEDAAVPQDMTLSGLQAQRDRDRELELARVLLDGEVSVEALGGEVYRFSGQKGWIQFHSTGEFMAELEEDAFPLATEAARHAAELLDKLEFDSRVLSDTVSEGTGSVVLGQVLNGTPILNCQAVLRYRDGYLVSITQGRRVPGTPEQMRSEAAMSVSTALMRMYNGLKELGDVYTRIESITPAYTMSVSLSGPARLDPVWHVKTDTGAYQMDTRTGQLSRVGGAVMAADAQQN